jgi:hypothetical protein
MGEGFQDAYFLTRLMHWKDQAAMEAIQGRKDVDPHQKNIDTLKLFFAGGKTPDETGQLTDLTAEDLDDWDVFTVATVVAQVGMPDPKELPSSTATTPATDASQPEWSDSATANDLD